jgi:hypothetical protein
MFWSFSVCRHQPTRAGCAPVRSVPPWRGFSISGASRAHQKLEKQPEQKQSKHKRQRQSHRPTAPAASAPSHYGSGSVQHLSLCALLKGQGYFSRNCALWPHRSGVPRNRLRGAFSDGWSRRALGQAVLQSLVSVTLAKVLQAGHQAAWTCLRDTSASRWLYLNIIPSLKDKLGPVPI